MQKKSAAMFFVSLEVFFHLGNVRSASLCYFRDIEDVSIVRIIFLTCILFLM